MKTRAFLFSVVAFVAFIVFRCAGVRVGPDPIPGVGVRVVVNVSGDFDGRVGAEQVPMTGLVRAHGRGTVTGRAFPPPFLTIDGDYDIVVEPTPGNEQAAIDAVTRGDILIRRRGVPGALNAPGSIASYKAALAAAHAATTAKPVKPPPPPPIASAACSDGSCTLPSFPTNGGCSR